MATKASPRNSSTIVKSHSISLPPEKSPYPTVVMTVKIQYNEKM